MPLTLVTGPANSEKAGPLLDGYRAAVVRGGKDAILVVPTFDDAERMRLELAQGGLVFGVRVEDFEGLLGEIGRRAGTRARPVGRVARERILAASIAQADLVVLAAAANTPGFARALGRLIDELEEQRIDPGRFTQALRQWAGERADARAYGDELAGLYSAYRRRLERLGRVDRPLQRAAALDALRREPGRWGATPVFVYGFDDLTPLQRDALETLGRVVDAPVTVSLSYEAGRAAFAARGEAAHELGAFARRTVEQPPNAEHYAAGSRTALHHLERGLFEPTDGSLFATVEAGGAIELLEGGGERAELELVGERIARLLRDGTPADEIAVVLRSPGDAAPLVHQVFGALGIPVVLHRRVPFSGVPIGRALLGLLRAALPHGEAGDLLAWLRAPGVVRQAQFVDQLEREARRRGARTAAAARELWEQEEGRWPLAALDRVAGAAERGGIALLERVSAELQRLLTSPHLDEERRGTAPILTAAEQIDAAACAAARRAITELARLAERDGRLAPSASELVTVLADLQVHVGGRAGAGSGAIEVTDPLGIRARRVRALFACGMQEGIFPKPARPEALLSDEQRRDLALASGIVLRRHDEDLEAERYLFYAMVSRPEELLVLSWRIADDGGEPAVRSFFVDDVCDLFADLDAERPTARRELGAVGWGPGRQESVATPREAQRAAALAQPRQAEPPIAPLQHPAVLATLAGRPTWSASQLEAFAGCPVKWFVERGLRPDGLEADPEPMAKGDLAHAALEAVIAALGEQTGSTQLTPERLPQLRVLVREALERLASTRRLSTDPARTRALARRLESDLLRYVEHTVSGGSPLAPRHTEVSFGLGEDSLPALQLAEGVSVGGRIDRIDVAPDDRAVVYDYKGKSASAQARWVADRRFQIALYVLAARELLSLDVAGGLYQPLGADDLRPRGALRDDPDLGIDVVDRDRLDAEHFEEVIGEVVEAVLATVAELRAGRLEPRPETCAWQGGCEFPTICRCQS